MKTLIYEQFIPASLDEVWSFFATPDNLNLITPGNMHFKTISDVPPKMYEGLIIRYRIKPMMNIPMTWVTRISALSEKEYFIDEQIKGPYKMWVHHHQFKVADKGVLMTDRITYKIGFGIFGTLLGILWVDRQVENIFRYRRNRVKSIFEKEIA